MAEIAWQVQIDWDDDGDWSEAYEDVSLYVQSASWHLGMSEPYQLVGDEIRCTLVVQNADKRFSPEYASSPYYGKMLPLRLVRVRSTYDGTTRVHYVGWTDTFQPEPGDGKTAVIECIGAKQYMQDQVIRLPLLRDKRSDEIIQAILLRLERPPALTGDLWVLGVPGASELGETTYLSDISPAVALDTGLTTFPYVGDSWDENAFRRKYVGEAWTEDFKGSEALEDTVRAERGRFFFDRDGKAVFWARDRLQKKIDLDETFDNEHVNVDYRFGASVADDVRVMAYPRKLSSATNIVLWVLAEEDTLRPGQTKTIQASYTDEDSRIETAGLGVYVATYTHTGDVSYVIEYQARGAKIELTNNDPFENTVSAMILAGQEISTFDKVELSARDNSIRGRHEYLIDPKLLNDTGLAQNIADYELYRRQTPRGEIWSIQIEDSTEFRRVQMLSRLMGNRIRVIDDQVCHDAEYFIIGEAHSVSVGEGYTVTWYLEPAEAMHFWILGEAGYSELGETTWLGL